MLIDDLRGQDIRFGPAKIRDAVVFRIYERADDFGIAQVSDELEPLPSLLPYNNMVIHFDGFCIWYLLDKVKPDQNSDYVIFGFFFSTNSFVLDAPRGLPSISFLSYIDSHSYQCNGMNIYYPSLKRMKYDHGEIPEDSPIDDMMGNSFKYLQAFLTLLSCKNIRADLETPDDKIQKKRVSKGKLPLVSYYILKIKNIAGSHKSEDRGLWSNRVHFCRGHMREYTADAPLFGRLVGRFWIPPHVRGNRNKGFIMKDYEVEVKK